jgi:hypothetical protein
MKLSQKYEVGLKKQMLNSFDDQIKFQISTTAFQQRSPKVVSLKYDSFFSLPASATFLCLMINFDLIRRQ